ncbi:hypothetical protein BC940DRAFT_348704 [Gongronella butleri]|nr:hypothetical protein BC940DRAFT_348704 [Gongronella butleri]
MDSNASFSSFLRLSGDDLFNSSSNDARDDRHASRSLSDGSIQRPAPAVPRLSVAERFMARNGSLPTPSLAQQASTMTSINLDDHDDAEPTDDENDDHYDHHDDNVDEKPKTKKKRPSTANSKALSPPLPHARPSTTSLPSSTLTKDTSRLTIADRFMKSSLSGRDHASSIAVSTYTATDQVHPLEGQQSQAADRRSTNFDLKLDLTLPPLQSYKRPFGSQDTLVGSPRGGGLEEKYGDKPGSALAAIGDVDEGEEGDDDEDDEDDASHASSTTRRGNEESDMDLQQRKHKKGGLHEYGDELDDELDDLERGCWVGTCCYVSCSSRRPKRQALALQQKKKRLAAEQKRRAQLQGQRACGKRRMCVVSLFVSLIVVSLLSFVLWPRTPLIRVEGASLLSPVRITETGQGTLVGNVQFESQWLVNFTMDNRANWLVPTRFIQMHLLVKDALSGNIIGKGFQNDHPEPVVLDPRAISNIHLAVALDYQARDLTDATFAGLKVACTLPPAPHSISSPPSNNNTNTNNGQNNGPNGSNGSNNNANHTITGRGINDADQHPVNGNHGSANGQNNNNNNNNSNSGSSNNNNTTSNSSAPPSASVPPISSSSSTSPDQRQSLSLQFWMTLRIWGLDVFGYRPTVVVTPANGGFLCPTS